MIRQKVGWHISPQIIVSSKPFLPVPRQFNLFQHSTT